MNDQALQLLNTIGSLRSFQPDFRLDVAALPHAALYFSIYGEDATLRAFFKRQLRKGQIGTYVDIGAATPFNASNTGFFYACGWRGLCVDANSIYGEAFARWRPEDVFVCTAVGEADGSAQLYRNVKQPGMTMLAETHPGPDYEGPEVVPVVRLDKLFAKHIGEKSIQFMSIDVEGAELGVLKSNDWSRWRPEAVLMECHGFAFDAPYAEPEVKFLVDQGYVIHSKIGPSVLMARG
ncbi:MAG: FkbM family methyltransferase [Rhodospirillaceae bacterium]